MSCTYLKLNWQPLNRYLFDLQWSLFWLGQKILHVCLAVCTFANGFQRWHESLGKPWILHMDAFFVPSRGTLSCGAGKNKEIHAYVAHQRVDLAKMKSSWNCTTSQKIICFSVHQLYSMQLGITLKIVALSTSDLKITYGVLFYMLEIVCIVKCGGKMHIWCLLACKKVSRDEEEGKVTSFFAFLCLVRQLYLGTNFSFSVCWALKAELAIYLPHFAYVMLRWGS